MILWRKRPTNLKRDQSFRSSLLLDERRYLPGFIHIRFWCILIDLIEGVFLGLVERVAVLMRAAMADQGDQAVQRNLHAMNPFLVLISAKQASEAGRRLERSIDSAVM